MKKIAGNRVTTCPLCGNNDYTQLYDLSKEYAGCYIVKCHACFHIYTLSNTTAAPGILYNDGVYKVIENRNSIFDKILNWEYKRVLTYLGKLKASKSQLLDFGSGKGKFAHLAREKGYQVKCVETSIERAAYAKDIYGLEVSTCYYSNGKIFNGQFNIISLFHVLEHLPKPQSLMSELIKSNLCENGIVVLEVPNYNSIQRKIAGKRWMHFDAQRHVSHFTPKQLNEFGKKLDLRELKTTFFSFHLGVLGMLDSVLKMFGYRRNIIFDLKNNMNIAGKIAIILLLPPAFLLEAFSSLLGSGGIVRKYFLLSS